MRGAKKCLYHQVLIVKNKLNWLNGDESYVCQSCISGYIPFNSSAFFLLLRQVFARSQHIKYLINSKFGMKILKMFMSLFKSCISKVMKEIYKNNNLKKSSKCWLIEHYTGDVKRVCMSILMALTANLNMRIKCTLLTASNVCCLLHTTCVLCT